MAAVRDDGPRVGLAGFLAALWLVSVIAAGYVGYRGGWHAAFDEIERFKPEVSCAR